MCSNTFFQTYDCAIFFTHTTLWTIFEHSVNILASPPFSSYSPNLLYLNHGEYGTLM